MLPYSHDRLARMRTIDASPTRASYRLPEEGEIPMCVTLGPSTNGTERMGACPSSYPRPALPGHVSTESLTVCRDDDLRKRIVTYDLQ